ncbi:MAG: EthD family reductase [Aggregatilineales bacterium]
MEAFEEHYRKVHIPLANRMARLKSYTVSSNISLVRGEEPYYIIGELEWDSMDDLRQDFQSPEGRATAQDVAILSQWSPGVRSMIYEVNETH